MKSFLSNLFEVETFHTVMSDLKPSHKETSKVFICCLQKRNSTNDDNSVFDDDDDSVFDDDDSDVDSVDAPDDDQLEWENLKSQHSGVPDDKSNDHQEHNCSRHCDPSQSSAFDVKKNGNDNDTDNVDELMNVLQKVPNTNGISTCELTETFNKLLECTKWKNESSRRRHTSKKCKDKDGLVVTPKIVKSLMKMMIMDDDSKTLSSEEKKTNIHGRYVSRQVKIESNDSTQDKDSIQRGSLVQYHGEPEKLYKVMAYSKKKNNRFQQHKHDDPLNLEEAKKEEKNSRKDETEEDDSTTDGEPQPPSKKKQKTSKKMIHIYHQTHKKDIQHATSSIK